jgi:hypothetical protein
MQRFSRRRGYKRILFGGERWSLRRTAGKQRLDMAFAGSRPAIWDSSLPWGRGENLRMREEGRSRRSDTVWRRRSTRLNAAEKPGTEGFQINTSVLNIFCRAATRSAYSTNLSPSRYPFIDRLPSVIATAHCSYMRPPNNVNHRGRVRTDALPSNMC